MTGHMAVHVMEMGKRAEMGEQACILVWHVNLELLLRWPNGDQGLGADA